MKYISADTETTGLDKEKCSIIEIGAIIEDTTKPNATFEELPKFECIVEHPEYTGSSFALNLNQRILSVLAGVETAEDKTKYRKENNICRVDEAAEKFFWFLYDNGFAELKKKWTEEKFLDSHPSLRGEFKKFQEEKPRSLKEVEKYYETPIVITVAGKNFARFDWDFFMKLPRWKPLIKFSQRVIDPAIYFADWGNDKRLPNSDECKRRAQLEGIVSHKAIEDAWDVIQLIRKGSNGYARNF